jgi:RNA polymerase sigma-70 factor (ECF subfamily)
VRAVRGRMDRKLVRRMDASDVVQEALLEATRRREDFDRQTKMSLYDWLRFLALQKLKEVQRRHVRAAKRDISREAHGEERWSGLSRGRATEAQGADPSPSAYLQQAERRHLLWDAMRTLSPLEQDILRLRHFCHMSNRQVAQALGLSESATSGRYVKALRSLATRLQQLRYDEA